jgi:hypothetical protein
MSRIFISGSSTGLGLMVLTQSGHRSSKFAVMHHASSPW